MAHGPAIGDDHEGITRNQACPATRNPELTPLFILREYPTLAGILSIEDQRELPTKPRVEGMRNPKSPAIALATMCSLTDTLSRAPRWRSFSSCSWYGQVRISRAGFVDVRCAIMCH